jgi:AraC-like DNA-binding protein
MNRIGSKPEDLKALEVAAHRGGGQRGSRLPAEVQEAAAHRLEAGWSISATARLLGLTRDQVRTVKYAMFGLTLAEVRALKRGSR